MVKQQDISSFSRIIIMIVVMTAATVDLLDTTIVNVALPHMQGSLGVTTDQISWVLTSYLIAAAVFMPLTGFLTERFGQKKFILMAIIGFVLTSALCGIAVNITQLVFFRLLQGAVGAFLIPLSQTIMIAIYPKEQRSKAMAIWGAGVMLGPILGPTVGGYITEIVTWRWCFYINVPIGLICVVLAMLVDFPESETTKKKMDWMGFLLIATSIGALQYFLDRGTIADWFHGTDICVAAFLMIVCFLCFLYHMSSGKKNLIFNPKTFKDFNFVVASLLLAFYFALLSALMFLLPLMAQNLLGYSPITVGLNLAPRAVSTVIGVILAQRLCKSVHPVILALIAVLFGCVGAYLNTFYNLDINEKWIIFPAIIQGFGVGFVFVPLSVIAFSTLPEKRHAEGSGLFSLLRSIGNSAGVSVSSTLLVRGSQHFWNQLGQYINRYNPDLLYYLNDLGLKQSDKNVPVLLGKILLRHADMLAFINVYMAITWAFALMIPFLFFLRMPKENKESHSVHME